MGLCEVVVLGVLIRSLQNLGAPGKGNGFIPFACTKRTKSTPKGCDPLDSRGRFKALSKKILAEFSDGTCRTLLFAQNGGEKALNRCDAPALQREDLERTTKEWPCSLQTVGYGWVGMGDGGRKRVTWDGNKERFVQKKNFLFSKGGLLRTMREVCENRKLLFVKKVGVLG